ncbi:hypothetical protein SynMINOS11_01192 [Synechococcus sp. Minos11]|nr:hypothetical protein SynMINOS11_01192 [Synechococcus sp. Minos11]CAK27999.1 Hypothetical protein SynRCC307_1096 [Synechococcus sp. RCC307]
MGPLHCPICIGLGLLSVTRTLAWLGLGRLMMSAQPSQGPELDQLTFCDLKP